MDLRDKRTLLYLIHAAFLLIAVTAFTKELGVGLEETKLASQGAKSTSVLKPTVGSLVSRFWLQYCMLLI